MLQTYLDELELDDMKRPPLIAYCIPCYRWLCLCIRVSYTNTHCRCVLASNLGGGSWFAAHVSQPGLVWDDVNMSDHLARCVSSKFQYICCSFSLSTISLLSTLLTITKYTKSHELHRTPIEYPTQNSSARFTKLFEARAA